MSGKKAEKTEIVFNSIWKEDLETTASLMKKYIQSLKDFPMDTLKSLLSQKDAIGYIARKGEGGTEIGFIIGSMIPTPTITFVAAIDPKSAREGIGGRLIDEVVEEVKRRNSKATKVIVSLPADMSDGVALYSSKNFLVQGFVKEVLGSTDMVHMIKYLKKKKRGLFRRP